MALSFLEIFGLTKKETSIYELLLKEGTLPVMTIIKKSGYKRGIVYKSLYSLQAKGLVTKEILGKKIHFTPQSPTKLTVLAEQAFESVQRAKVEMQTLLPNLVKDYIHSVERPVVLQYEGKEGLQEVFEDVYAPKNEPVYGCVDLEHASEALSQQIPKRLIPLRIRNRVQAKTFIGESPTARKVQGLDTKQLRESVLLNKTDYPLPAEIDVYEDKVALMSFAQNEFVGLIIQNQDIATSIKSIFKFAHDMGMGAQNYTTSAKEQE